MNTKGVTRTWKLYGPNGHIQRESFSESYIYEFSDPEFDQICIIEVLNSDKTGTNEYTQVNITRNTYEDCETMLYAQLSDGIFEDCKVGIIQEIPRIEKNNG